MVCMPWPRPRAFWPSSVVPFASQFAARWLPALRRNPWTRRLGSAFPVAPAATTLRNSVLVRHVENFAESARTLLRGQGKELPRCQESGARLCSHSQHLQGSQSTFEAFELFQVVRASGFQARDSAATPRWGRHFGEEFQRPDLRPSAVNQSWSSPEELRRGERP